MNGIDDDCNNVIDDDAIGQVAYYEDLDEDGFGNPDQVVYSCDVLEDMLVNDQDCDDTNPEVNPLGTEFCNGEDDNCNSIVDDYEDGLKMHNIGTVILMKMGLEILEVGIWLAINLPDMSPEF